MLKLKLKPMSSVEDYDDLKFSKYFEEFKSISELEKGFLLK